MATVTAQAPAAPSIGNKMVMPAKRFKKIKNDVDVTPSVVVFNPTGTAFMADAGMHAIIVTFPKMKDMNMEPGQLYNLSLKTRKGDKLESLYFSKKPKQGELMLFKWQKDGLSRLTTMMSGNHKALQYANIEAGDTFEVEEVYHIRERVNATPAEVIKCIKDDVRMLERNMNIRCELNGCRRVGQKAQVYGAGKSSTSSKMETSVSS